MASDILIDGARLAWPEFADRLIALRDRSTHEACAGWVRAPHKCGAQTARLISDLDLGDWVALLDEHTARPRQQPTGRHAVSILVQAASRIVSRLSRPQPVHDSSFASAADFTAA